LGLKSYIAFALPLLLLVGCQFPQFSFKSGGKGTKELPGKYLFIEQIENRSSLASSNSSTLFTEELRDLMLSQTSFSLASNESASDWILTGYISDYRIAPVGIAAGTETAEQNRLTMQVKITCSYNPDRMPEDEESVKAIESAMFENSAFSAFVDFNSDTEFTSIEEELVTEINAQLTQDIFDKAFGGEW